MLLGTQLNCMLTDVMTNAMTDINPNDRTVRELLDLCGKARRNPNEEFQAHFFTDNVNIDIEGALTPCTQGEIDAVVKAREIGKEKRNEDGALLEWGADNKEALKKLKYVENKLIFQTNMAEEFLLIHTLLGVEKFSTKITERIKTSVKNVSPPKFEGSVNMRPTLRDVDVLRTSLLWKPTDAFLKTTFNKRAWARNQIYRTNVNFEGYAYWNAAMVCFVAKRHVKMADEDLSLLLRLLPFNETFELTAMLAPQTKEKNVPGRNWHLSRLSPERYDRRLVLLIRSFNNEITDHRERTGRRYPARDVSGAKYDGCTEGLRDALTEIFNTHKESAREFADTSRGKI